MRLGTYLEKDNKTNHFFVLDTPSTHPQAAPLLPALELPAVES